MIVADMGFVEVACGDGGGDCGDRGDVGDDDDS